MTSVNVNGNQPRTADVKRRICLPRMRSPACPPKHVRIVHLTSPHARKKENVSEDRGWSLGVRMLTYVVQRMRFAHSLKGGKLRLRVKRNLKTTQICIY